MLSVSLASSFPGQAERLQVRPCGKLRPTTCTGVLKSAASRLSFTGMVMAPPMPAVTSGTLTLSVNWGRSRTASTSSRSRRVIVGMFCWGTGQVIVADRTSRTTCLPSIVAVPSTRIGPVHGLGVGRGIEDQTAEFWLGGHGLRRHADPRRQVSAGQRDRALEAVEPPHVDGEKASCPSRPKHAGVRADRGKRHGDQAEVRLLRREADAVQMARGPPVSRPRGSRPGGSRCRPPGTTKRYRAGSSRRV